MFWWSFISSVKDTGPRWSRLSRCPPYAGPGGSRPPDRAQAGVGHEGQQRWLHPHPAQPAAPTWWPQAEAWSTPAACTHLTQPTCSLPCTPTPLGWASHPHPSLASALDARPLSPHLLLQHQHAGSPRPLPTDGPLGARGASLVSGSRVAVGMRPSVRGMRSGTTMACDLREPTWPYLRHLLTQGGHRRDGPPAGSGPGGPRPGSCPLCTSQAPKEGIPWEAGEAASWPAWLWLCLGSKPRKFDAESEPCSFLASLCPLQGQLETDSLCLVTAAPSAPFPRPASGALGWKLPASEQGGCVGVHSSQPWARVHLRG